MADKTECANCEREAATGSALCLKCEQKWMRDRDKIVETAELLTRRNAEFREWCLLHDQPYP